MEKIKIFVDYGNRDGKDIPSTLVEYLRGKGYDVWWDQDLEFGVNWSEEIFKQIHERDVLIIFVGEGAQNSNWVRRIIDVARGSHMSIMPIRLTDIYDFQIDPLYLKDFQFLVHNPGENWDTLTKLERSIERLAQRTRSTRRLYFKSDDDMISKAIFGLPVVEAKFECDIFMVMPFREHLNPVYEDHIKKVATELDLKIRRGDDPFSEHDIMREIWSYIYNSRIVIADCTDRNPNVFYELGIAHTLGKPAILITQNIDDVPFDVRGKRAILYKYDPRSIQKFEQELKRAIQSLLDEGKDVNRD